MSDKPNQYLRKAVGFSARCIVLSVGFLFSSFLSLHVVRTLLRGPQRLFYVKPRPKPPAITLDSRYGSHSVAKIDEQISLHYVAKGKKGAPLVLLLHGFPECWWSWRHQLAALGEEYYVVAFDMRGYCESSKPGNVESYHIRDLLNDVRGLIAHLGYEKCTLVGHDWGGVVSWHFAARFPSQVEKLVVLSCPHPAVFRGNVTNVGQILKWAHMFYLQLPIFPEFVFRCDDFKLFEYAYRDKRMGIADRELMTDQDLEMFKYAFSQHGALTGAMNYYRAQFSTDTLASMLLPVARKQSDRPSESRSRLIQPKTLILWGCRDLVLPRNLAAASQKFCQDSQVQYFENASHWLQQHEPAGVNEAIKKFLQQN